MPKSDLPIFLERAYYKISAEPSFAFESLSDPYKRDTYINDNVLGSGDPYPNTPIDIVFNWLSLQDPYFASEILDKNPALLEKYIHSFDVSPSSFSFQEETIHNTFCAANNLTPKIDLPSKVEARLEGENYSNISNYFRWHLFKIQRVIHSGDQHDLILKIYKNYYIDSLKPADYRNNLRNIFTNLKNSESIALSEKITKEFDSLPCQIYFLSFDKHITSVVVSDSYIFEGNRGYGRGNNIPGINVYKKPEDWKINILETIDNKEKYLNIFEQLGQPIYQNEMSPQKIGNCAYHSQLTPIVPILAIEEMQKHPELSIEEVMNKVKPEYKKIKHLIKHSMDDLFYHVSDLNIKLPVSTKIMIEKLIKDSYKGKEATIDKALCEKVFKKVDKETLAKLAAESYKDFFKNSCHIDSSINIGKAKEVGDVMKDYGIDLSLNCDLYDLFCKHYLFSDLMGDVI